jgi:ABC-type thiamine transport system ATPase subunit
MGASPPLKTAANRTLRLSMSACVMGLLTWMRLLPATPGGGSRVAQSVYVVITQV